MKIFVTVKSTIIFSSTLVLILIGGVLSAQAKNGDQLNFLLRFQPKVSTSISVTGGGYEERVRMHSLVFNPKQAQKVLPELDKVLTKRQGWIRYASKYAARKGSSREEYVIYKRRGTRVSYMSDYVYRHLIREKGTKILSTKRGECVVEYFSLKR